MLFFVGPWRPFPDTVFTNLDTGHVEPKGPFIDNVRGACCVCAEPGPDGRREIVEAVVPGDDNAWMTF
jgi:hypothetical protein